jgi:hypothetical protein
MISQYLYASTVPLLCKERTFYNRSGLFFQLTLMDGLTIIHEASRRPLTDGARRLLELDVNPRATLLLVSWLSACSYNSSRTALRGILHELVDDGERWLERHDRLFAPHKPILFVRPKFWSDAALPAPSEDLHEVRIKAKREYADV